MLKLLEITPSDYGSANLFSMRQRPCLFKTASSSVGAFASLLSGVASWQLCNLYQIHCSVAGPVFFARCFISETSRRDQYWSHMGKRKKTSASSQRCWFWSFVGLFFHPFAITSTLKGLNWWEWYCNEMLSVIVVSAANVSQWAAVRLRFSFSKG